MSNASLSVRSREIGRKLWKALRHVFFHNGWVKLIALLISLVLWAGLISQDESITRDKTWQNVNVSISGQDTLKRNGYIVVTDLDSLLSNVTVTAAVPQKQYDFAEPSAYNLRVDLSKINGTGEQEIKILSTANNTYGKVINTVPSVINVEVEEYIAGSELNVFASIKDTANKAWYKDWYIEISKVNPYQIKINGPVSLVTLVTSAKIQIDPETMQWSEGTMMTTGEIKLYNRAGEEIASPLLGITYDAYTIDTVLLEIDVLPTKSFQTSDMIDLSGKVKKGFRITSVKISPETITVAARSEVLEQLDELPFEINENIDNLSSDKTFQIEVLKPSSDAVLSNDTISVKVEIEPDDN